MFWFQAQLKIWFTYIPETNKEIISIYLLIEFTFRLELIE